MDRDLDAKIAECIFGWIPVSVGLDYNGENSGEVLYPPNETPTQDFYNSLPRVGKVHRGWYAPRYTSDLNLAINLCKHVGIPLLVNDMSNNPEVLSKQAFDYWTSSNKK